MKENLYNVLGVDKDATADEIKKAFRDKSKNNHPDKGGNNDKQADTNHAYQVLSNPIKRKKYDETGEEYERPFEERFNVFIQQIFFQIIEATPNYKENDLIDMFKETIYELIERSDKEYKEYQKKIDKLTNIKKRIKCEKRNNIVEVIETNIRDTKVISTNLRSDMEFLQNVIVRLKDYNYECDIIEKNNEFYGYYNSINNI